MKSFVIILITLFLSIPLAFGECIQITNNDIQVSWTAFKTPSKAGVGGKFTALTLNGKKKADSIKKILMNSKLVINSSKLSTKNKARDVKISKFFFGNLKGNEIIAQVVKMNAKKLTLKVKMNAQQKVVTMNYQIKDHQLEASGFIDILDFGASKSLKAINKACYALHEGKTWSDVGISLIANFKSCI